jgi:phage gp29-like protein
MAQLMLNAEQGDLVAQAELFMDMEEKDAHLSAELSKRKMAVKKLDWQLMPPRDATSKEEDNTRLLEALIRDEVDMGAIRLDMLDAIGHGYSCIELGWHRNLQGFWYPKTTEHRPPSWFTLPQDNRNALYLRTDNNLNGEPLQPFGWIPHVHKSRSGYLSRAGLHRVLAWPYLYKNYSVRDLAEFLEIYGLPVRIGKYPANTGDNAKKELMKAVLSIGHNAAGIIPDSMQVELQSVLAQGNAEAFKVMMDWCEASQSKAILGGTLTSQTGANGNRSLGDVHNEVRLDIRDDDASQLDVSLSAYLVYPMAILNGLFADNRVPEFVSDTQEPDDLKLYSEAIPKLVSVGAKIPLDYVNKKLKIPLPDEDEPILEPVSQTVPQSAITPLSATVSPISAGADPSPVSALEDQLVEDSSTAVASLLAVIRSKVEKATSLTALRDDLLSSYGDLDSDELVKIMELGFLTAELAGRFDVNEGG